MEEKLVEKVLEKVRINKRIKFQPQTAFDIGEITGTLNPDDPNEKVLALSTPGMYCWQVNHEQNGPVTVELSMFVSSEYGNPEDSDKPLLTLIGETYDEKEIDVYGSWRIIELTSNGVKDKSMGLEINLSSPRDNTMVYLRSIEVKK